MAPSIFPASTPDLLRGYDLKLHTNAPGAAPSHPGVISRRAVYLGESAPQNTSWLEVGSSDRFGTWPAVLDVKVSLPARQTC